jgi:thiamine biosynthesis protein ThiI
VTPISPARVERRRGRILVVPERRAEAVARRIQDVFGVASVSVATRCERDLDAMASAAIEATSQALLDHSGESAVPFRVRSSRGDKSFALNSMQLDRELGARVLAAHPRLRVDLDEPKIVVGVDLRDEAAYVFARRMRGHGGLPVGSLGRALALISGGIDSPVAAWLAMKRGLSLAYATFHSQPFIGEPSKKKVIDLVGVLSRFQPRHSRLWIAPFADVQLAVREIGSPSYRTVLYRRMMQRIASRLAAREEATALVTGESLGQVASQTLENLTCIQAAATLPVLRPLISYDKEETVGLARAIGTFEISAVQEPDCCTLFMPDRPVIRGELEVCAELESRLDVQSLVERAFEGAELVSIPPEP